MPFNEETPLSSSFGSISRIGAGVFLAKGRFGHRAIHRLPFPIETFEFIVVQETLRLPLSENACLCPFLKTSMCTAAGADPCRIQCFPLTSCSQTRANGIHRLAVIRAWAMTSSWMWLAWGEQGVKFHPYFIWDSPTVAGREMAHFFLCASVCASGKVDQWWHMLNETTWQADHPLVRHRRAMSP